MKIIKNIFKILANIFLIIIPICLILYSMFSGFLGCYLMFNNDSKIETLLTEEVDFKNIKIVFLDTNAGDDNNIILINKNLSIKNTYISTDNKLVEYVKTNGIDLYNTINVINYIYILIVAIIIFFKKFLENVDMFGKFQERDN